MKTVLVTIVTLLLLSVSAMAMGVGSIDNECMTHGFDYGVVKYECDPQAPDEGNGSAVNVTWFNSCDYVNWTATTSVHGVLSKEATNTYVHAGGLSGSVLKTDKHDISHVTFCANDDVPQNDVPEFGFLAVAGIMVAAAGLILFKRK